MPHIAVNTYRLPIVEKLARGQTIIDMSTANPSVPGNEAALAAFAAVQEKLAAAASAYSVAVSTAHDLLNARDRLLAEWNLAINNLAAITEYATGGDITAILSSGFAVRSRKSSPKPVAQITGLSVALTDKPGYSEVTWKRDPHADAYRLQWIPENLTEEGWRDVGIVVEARFHGNGVTPGQHCWYRVAGVNRFGQGPWSNPAPRPVL